MDDLNTTKIALSSNSPSFFIFSKARHRLNGDQMDVPVRAGYRIMGNDDDGFLEDGIIVKTKGTGYIDARYRSRYPGGHKQTQQTETSASQPQPAYYHYTSRNLRPSTSEIIYGQRNWF